MPNGKVDRRKMSAQVHIGTSGWHYKHWKGPFYPEDIPSCEMLGFYAARFSDAEINNSFYHLPEAGTLACWRDAVPEGFSFAVKASRYITHMKKLKDPQAPVAKFLERVEVLGKKLGPILFQLPPNWRPNPGRLKDFICCLPEGHRYVFEFRDPRWFDDQIYRLLEDSGAAFCIYHLAGAESPKKVTGDFVYIRLHGPDAAYQGSYSPQDLSGWAGAISSWMRQGKDVYCFFDNDQSGYAPADAMKLKEMLSDYKEETDDEAQ